LEYLQNIYHEREQLNLGTSLFQAFLVKLSRKIIFVRLNQVILLIH